MIYIEADQDTILPSKYRKINNLSAIIYDQITEILLTETYENFRGDRLDFDENNQVQIDEFIERKVHVLDWLKANQLQEDLTRILTKNITLAIISDFSNFIYESLSCAQRGKMTVAYALLRKPFTDELLILEQLLYDPDDFTQRFFHSGDPDLYDPSHGNIDKKAIIENAITIMKPQTFFNKDLIYDLRYNKSVAGLNGMTNHALHIVTRDKRYKTEDQNFNFIFSSEEDVDRYWKHYYYFVPYLLLYSANLIDNIVFRYLPDKLHQDLKAIKSFKRLIGMLLWAELTDNHKELANTDMFDSLIDSLIMHCNKCQKGVQLSKLDLELMFNSGFIPCPNCFEDLLSNPESVESIVNIAESIN